MRLQLDFQEGRCNDKWQKVREDLHQQTWKQEEKSVVKEAWRSIQSVAFKQLTKKHDSVLLGQEEEHNETLLHILKQMVTMPSVLVPDKIISDK